MRLGEVQVIKFLEDNETHCQTKDIKCPVISPRSFLYICTLIEGPDLTSMAQPQKFKLNRPHASPSNKKIDCVGSDTRDSRYKDKFLFYSALARHTIGDPAYHESILHAVQTHYWRVLVDKSNPYHDVYALFEEIKFRPNIKFFSALSSPDYWLCPTGWQIDSRSILQVVSNALNIKIVIWRKRRKTLIWEGGPVEFPEYHVEFPDDTSCIALTPDNDGRALIEFLESERYRLEKETGENALRIRRLVWWRPRDPVEDDDSSDPVKDDDSSDPVEDNDSSDSDSGSDPVPDPVPDPGLDSNREKIAYQCYNEYAVSLHL